MDPDRAELEARLTAIEYLLADLFNKAGMLLGATEEQLAERDRDMLDQLSRRSFPSLDPARSDLAASLIHEAVERMLSMMKEMRTMYK